MIPRRVLRKENYIGKVVLEEKIKKYVLFMKTIRTARLPKNTVCLLRLDLNIQKNELKNSLRLQRAAESVLFLRAKGLRVVIVSHIGRPSQKSKILISNAQLSLKPIAKELSKSIGEKIYFFNTVNFDAVARSVTTRTESVFMLENIRFFKEEEKNDAGFAKRLASVADVYVNDAFAVSHRAHASVHAITRYLPSYGGIIMEDELRALDAVSRKPRKPLVVILGGAKVPDKVGVIRNVYTQADLFLLGGGVANTFFAAGRLPVGESLVERNSFLVVKPWLDNKKICVPDDVVLHKRAIVDIGEAAQKTFTAFIRKAGTIVWNGPMGLLEKKPYDAGTIAIARAVARSKAFSVVGGGETTSLILKNKLDKKISYLSTGGGAMLEYLAGKKLPGVEALQKNK